MMQKWMNRTSALSKSFNVQFTVCHIAGLPAVGFLERDKNHLTVQIVWKGGKRLASYLLKQEVERNCTSRKSIQLDGTINWNEEFNHHCKLRLIDSHRFRNWAINLEIHGSGQESNFAPVVLAKASINIAEFASPDKCSKRVINIPVQCSVGRKTAKGVLTVALAVSEMQTVGNNGVVHPLSQAASSGIQINYSPHRNCFCIKTDKTTSFRLSIDSTNSDPSRDQTSEFSYENLAAANHLFEVEITRAATGYYRDEKYDLSPYDQFRQLASLVRLRSLKQMLSSFKPLEQPKDTPLLNKFYGDDGGDDIDNERRYQLSPSQVRDIQKEDDFCASGFLSSDRFEVGTWESKELMSRDGKLKLVTECFLASIDQRSKKAAGSSACTVLATIIADWLHQNPKLLPLRCELNKLIREGSSVWRNICQDEKYKCKFSDQHFDLETVLHAGVRPISVVPEKSFVGFFMFEDMPENLHFLQGVVSFDRIWEEIQSDEAAFEQVYIVSWNDHFFVLKIEIDAIYIIDTLGERLSEGCQNAYILKFSKESKLYSMKPDQPKENAASERTPPQGSKNPRGEVRFSQEMVSEGKATCKDFIKGFLAALPLSQLQANIKKGLKCEAPLHHLLQIEFHHTAPCSINLFPSLQTET